MGTIADKLLYLSGTKDAIKAAIESMGQSVSSSATFRSFADLIKNISKDATATAANILSGKTAYVGGAKVTGTMANNGEKTAYIENNGESVTISEGYYSGGSITADITNLTAANIKSGVTVGGEEGTFTSDATATAADIVSGKTAYVNGEKITGVMDNIGAVTATLTAKGQSYTIPKGYHNGNGNVSATYVGGYTNASLDSKGAVTSQSSISSKSYAKLTSVTLSGNTLKIYGKTGTGATTSSFGSEKLWGTVTLS